MKLHCKRDPFSFKKIRWTCIRAMWDRAAMDFFWQLILIVRKTDISHVYDTVIKERVPMNHLPHLQTDWLFYVLQICHRCVKCDIPVYRPSVYFRKNTICLYGVEMIVSSTPYETQRIVNSYIPMESRRKKQYQKPQILTTILHVGL